jgi:hypothetical protein
MCAVHKLTSSEVVACMCDMLPNAHPAGALSHCKFVYLLSSLPVPTQSSCQHGKARGAHVYTLTVLDLRSNWVVTSITRA